MGKKNDDLAKRAIERAASLAEANPSLFKGSVNRDTPYKIVFRFVIPSGSVDLDFTVDPMPWALTIIGSNKAANAKTDERYLGFGIFEMLRRLVGMVAVSVTGAALATHFDLGPMIAIDEISETARVDRSILASLPKQDVREMLDDIASWMAIIQNDDGGQGNKPIVGPNGEERVCHAVSTNIARFKAIKETYKLVRKDWEQRQSTRNQPVNDKKWKSHWTQILGPRAFPVFSANTIALFVDSEPKKRTPTYLACSYWAPFFGFETSTLDSKFKKWKKGNKP